MPIEQIQYSNMSEAQQSYTILVIEDDPLVRKGIAVYLESTSNHKIFQAKDGQEGLEIFRRAAPDLVLTDLRLPKLDGMELLSSIREKSPDTPVIIVSGMGTLEDAVKALHLGARDYITKPISDMAILSHAIKQALEQLSLLKENRRYQQFLEKEVEKKSTALLQAQKLEAVGTLAGGVAHDFNNILAAIMGFTDLALLQTDQHQEIASDLRQIKKASLRAKDLVQQLLTFSRKSHTQQRAIQPALIIKEALKLLRATLPTTVQIKQHINSSQATILGDPTEIHQLLTNLCTNAFHALPNEQGTISVDLDVYTHTAFKAKQDEELDEGEYLKLQVSDDGCGMDKATLATIFDPFFTTKSEGQGTGLGLSMVHGIVKRGKGTIQVHSKVDKGTTFTILFPLAKTEKPPKSSVAIIPPGGSEYILFVDDEEPLRLLAEKMLGYLGYHVYTCASGKAALEKLQENPKEIDLVITDQSMPHMPGTELAGIIQSRYPGLPIILCTGYSSMINEEMAHEMGIRSFLLKPLTITKLALELRNILDG